MDSFKEAEKRALITGVTGRDGSHFSELLLVKGPIVHGIQRRAPSFNTKLIDHLFPDPHEENVGFHVHYGDMTDATNPVRIIKEVEPDEIYDLAAQSHVRVSFDTAEYGATKGTTSLTLFASDTWGADERTAILRVIDSGR